MNMLNEYIYVLMYAGPSGEEEGGNSCILIQSSFHVKNGVLDYSYIYVCTHMCFRGTISHEYRMRWHTLLTHLE